MNKKAINFNADLPGRVFSDSILEGNILYISGQIGTKEGEDNSFEKQFRRIMEKITALLEKASMTIDNIIKANFYLADRKHFPEMNRLFMEYFKEIPPARSTIITGLVNENMLIEIDAIASK